MLLNGEIIMKKIRNFKCDNTDTVIERLVHDDVSAVTCTCLTLSKRTLSAPRYMGNTVGGSPGSIYKKK